ncbi:MAG: DUF4097 family beta strand repeat-containing protein [Gaiellaceae bacterium]
MHRFPTERARLKVRNPSGDVQVETADVAETTVDLVPLNDSDTTREAIAKATVSARGDDVTVELEGGRTWSISIGNWGIGSAKVSVRITCPNGSDVECETASADVRVRGTLGEARVRTASGDLRLERIEGILEAKTASGDIQVDHVAGRATVGSVSGDVAVRTAMSGLGVNSVSGDVVVGEVFGDLSVGTVSGDAIVRAAGPGEVALKAVSGDVAVAMRRGLRVRLDVNSVSGSIGSELEVSDAAPSSDGPEASLRVRTVSGDVKISRAAEAIA